jgi:transposase
MQLDFKDVLASIAGLDVKLHMFVARLTYSRTFFARCYYAEDRPSLFDGIVSACFYFRGIPREGVFDNASTAVNRVLRGRDRELQPDFAALAGHLALTMQFAAPAKGNEKGGVEGLHGFVEDNFFRPMPEYASVSDLNTGLDSIANDTLGRSIGGESVQDDLRASKVNCVLFQRPLHRRILLQTPVSTSLQR